MGSLAERVVSPISKKELERRWMAVRRLMQERRLDALLMQNNNDFMGGYVKWFTDIPATNGYPVTVVFPATEAMTVISQGPFGADVAIEGEGAEVRRGVKRLLGVPSYTTVNYSLAYDADLAAQALKPYSQGRIGLIGLGSLPISLIERLKHESSMTAEFVDATDIVDDIKAIKSAEEIQMIRRTAFVQDQAMKAAFVAAAPGKRDIELAAVAEHTVLDLGGEQGLFMCASSPLGTPAVKGLRHFQNRMIRAGDQFTLLVESSGPGGYYAELGRTCVLGKASSELRNEFAFALEARNFALTLLTPGATGREVWETYNEFMAKNGRPPEKRLFCHGMGYDMVERPLLRFDEPMKLKANMVVSVHPEYVAGSVCSWVCDNYLIKENGPPERLHAFPETITEILA